MSRMGVTFTFRPGRMGSGERVEQVAMIGEWEARNVGMAEAGHAASCPRRCFYRLSWFLSFLSKNDDGDVSRYIVVGLSGWWVSSVSLVSSVLLVYIGAYIDYQGVRRGIDYSFNYGLILDQRTFHVGRCFVWSFWRVQSLMERSFLSRFVRYFYVCSCVIRFIFNTLQLIVYWPAISLGLALKVTVTSC